MSPEHHARQKMKSKSRSGAPWTEAKVKWLGRKPDSQVAQHFGRTLQEVLAERERRRVKLVPSPRWTPEEDRLLGSAPDRELAARLNRTTGAVSTRRHVLRIRDGTPKPD